MGFHELNTNLSSRQIYLDSKDANYYIDNNFSNPVWIFSEHITCPDYASMLVSVVDVQIPVSFYNIDSNNNTLFASSNITPQAFTIPQGNYNVYSLMDYLNNNMKLGDPPTNFTVTYDSTTNGFTFTSPFNQHWAIYGSEYSSALSVLGFSDKIHQSTLVDGNYIIKSDIYL